jgi:hypothetical protein
MACATPAESYGELTLDWGLHLSSVKDLAAERLPRSAPARGIPKRPAGTDIGNGDLIAPSISR